MAKNVTPQMLRILADIGRLSSSPLNVNNGQLARSILLGASLPTGPGFKTSNSESESSGGPSVISRIFDVLSRPNYAIANAANTIVELQKKNQNILANLGEVGGAAVEGLEGQAKTTFSKVLETAGVPDIPARALAGFSLDVGLDPTTYIGAGAVKGVVKAGAKALGKDIFKAAEAAIPPRVAGTLSVTRRAPTPEPLPGPSVISRPGEVPISVPPVGRAAGARQGATAQNIVLSPDARRSLAELAPGDPNVPIPTVPEATAYQRTFSDFMAKSAARKAALEGTPVGPRPRRADFPTAQAHAQAVSAWKATAAPGPAAQVVKAQDLVERIAEGEMPAVRATAPPVPTTPAASVEQRTNAVLTARSFVGSVRNGITERTLNPTQQLRLFNRFLKNTVGTTEERVAQALTKQRAAEEYLSSRGYRLKYWDGIGVKLSEVVDRLGGPSRVTLDQLKDLTKTNPSDPAVLQAIEATRARTVMSETPILGLGLEQASRQSAVADAISSPARAANYQKQIADGLKTALSNASVSPGSIASTQNLFKAIQQSNAGILQNALDLNKNTIKLVVSGNKKSWQRVNAATTKAAEVVVGVDEKLAAKQLGLLNRAASFMAVRFASHYGVKDLRPFVLDKLLSAEAFANLRHRLWRPLIQSTTSGDRLTAFNIARGVLDPAGYPQAVQDAANTLRDSMERLFSSSGVRDEASSVSLRAGFVREDLNKELKTLGSEVYFDEAKGTDWLKNWEKWELEGDPINIIAKLETAVERLSKKYALYDDIAARWGTTTPTGEFKYRLQHHRFNGVWFSRDIVQQVQQVFKTIDDMYDPKSRFAKYLDEALSIWKTSVTIYSPAHHIRNGIGDAWLSWIGGVNNPAVYRTAARIMRAQAGRYRTLPELETLISRRATARKLPPILRTRNGKHLNADQIYIAAHQRGLLLGASQIEDIFGEPLLRGKIQPFGGRVHDAVASVSENREHFFRLAHFVDAVKKSKAKDLNAIFDDAAHQVRKWHPDGMDLTAFERKYLRRLFPFYSWSRKALPLVLEAIVEKPGKVLVYPKGIQALQEAMGIEAPSRSDPFPTDQLFPDWIREKGIGPLGLSGAGGLTGFIGDIARQGVDPVSGNPIGGYALVNPSNPQIDVISSLVGGGNVKSAVGAIGEQLNPALRIPAELLTGHNVQTGAPVRDTGQQLADYATAQVPIASILSRLTNVGLGGPTGRGEREGLGNLEALINQLTAAGLLGTGPYQRQAQFELRDKLNANR